MVNNQSILEGVLIIILLTLSTSCSSLETSLKPCSKYKLEKTIVNEEMDISLQISNNWAVESIENDKSKLLSILVLDTSNVGLVGIGIYNIHKDLNFDIEISSFEKIIRDTINNGDIKLNGIKYQWLLASEESHGDGQIINHLNLYKRKDRKSFYLIQITTKSVLLKDSFDNILCKVIDFLNSIKYIK